MTCGSMRLSCRVHQSSRNRNDQHAERLQVSVRPTLTTSLTHPVLQGGHSRASHGFVREWFRSAVLVVLGGLAALVLAALVLEYGVVLVLGGLVLGAAAVVMLLQPQVATLLTIFLLYINAPAVLTQQHGLPELVAGAFILLLGVPILNTVIARQERLRFDATCVLMLGFLGTL